MIVEFLMADEDHTWDTVIINAPLPETATTADMQAWAERILAPQTRYRRVVLWAVYAYGPDVGIDPDEIPEEYQPEDTA